MENIIWKAVEGYEGYYEVSNTGLVKSLSREKRGLHGKFMSKDRILKQDVRENYCRVRLYKDGTPRSFLVHVLVARAFHSKSENKAVVNHINNDGKNNNAYNLEWVTHKENAIHAVEIGAMFKIYIPKEDLLELYINNKKSATEIGKIYNVSKQVIYKRLKEYGIEIRNASESHDKYNITEEFLNNELIIKGKTHSAVSEELGCSESLISQYAKKYNIMTKRRKN